MEFFDLIPLDEAVESLIGALEENLMEEEVPVEESLGRVLSRDVLAPEPLPGFSRSAMDGYAVNAADTFGAGEGLPAYLTVAGEIVMGESPGRPLLTGEAMAVATGGVMPEGADAVVMVEMTERKGETLEVVRAVAPGENVVEEGEDVSEGSTVFLAGQVLNPPQIGALVGLGISRVSVYRLPVVGIISTGDELVPPRTKPGPGQIRDINSAALAAALRKAGCLSREYGIVSDDQGKLKEAVTGALRECDAVLISGGSSVGTRDVTVKVMGELGPPGVLAHGLYLKPGKPTLVAVSEGRMVLGLPGNPASALTVFDLVAVPALRVLRGEKISSVVRPPRIVRARLGRSLSSQSGRLDLVRVKLEREPDGLVAIPVLGKSSLIGTLARARGQVRIPEGTEGLEAGETVMVELLD